MRIRKWNDNDFINAVKNSRSYAGVLKTLNLKVAGSNYDTIKRKIKELNLDITHMTGQGWNVGEKYRNFNKVKGLSEILVKDSSYISTYHLKDRLFKEGLKEKRCECCNNTEWFGKPIALELHHINGIKNDLRLENLQILCPNCHAFTDNYRGKNMNK